MSVNRTNGALASRWPLTLLASTYLPIDLLPQLDLGRPSSCCPVLRLGFGFTPLPVLSRLNAVLHSTAWSSACGSAVRLSCLVLSCLSTHPPATPNLLHGTQAISTLACLHPPSRHRLGPPLPRPSSNPNDGWHAHSFSQRVSSWTLTRKKLAPPFLFYLFPTSRVNLPS